MSNDILKIKCPHCGAVLAVKNIPNIETKVVPCPICKQKSPFLNFKVLPQNNQPQVDPGTDLPEGMGGQPRGNNPELTDYDQNGNVPSKTPLFSVKVAGSPKGFLLREGRNVIGRKAQASQATIQIDTHGQKRMSREHIVINVTASPLMGYVHTVSLYKQQVNATMVNNQQLMFGDEVVLKSNDLIQLPDATLRIVSPDEDETVF